MKLLKKQNNVLKTKSRDLSIIVCSDNIYFLKYRDFVKKIIVVMLNTLYL